MPLPAEPSSGVPAAAVTKASDRQTGVHPSPRDDRFIDEPADPRPYRPAANHAHPGTWTRERAIAALHDWHREFGESPRGYEWSPGSARSAGLDTPRTRRWEREHPRWPSSATVHKYLGPRWGDALVEVGLPARWQAGWSVPLPERVHAARRMHAAGQSAASIADYLGVCADTVRAYLRAGACTACGGPVVRTGSTGLCVQCASARRRRRAPRDEIVAALRAWAAETGEPPRREEWVATDDPGSKWAREYPRWPRAMAVRTAFGHWNAALEAAGYAPHRQEWEPDDMIGALRRFADEHGRPPTQEELASPPPGVPRAHHLIYEWGSFNQAVEAAGLTPGRRRWSPEQIVAAMRSFAERHGRPPRSTDWKTSTVEHPWAGTVTDRFGSWPAALEAAGFTPSKRAWTRGSIVEAVRRFARERGRPPKYTEWKHRDPGGRWPGAPTVVAHFGSWGDAMAAAGLRAERPRWTRESILAAMRRYAFEHGRLPEWEEWAKPDPERRWPTPATVQKHFGRWRHAIVQAGGSSAGRNGAGGSRVPAGR